MKKIIAITFFLLLARAAYAAEFQVVDRLVVDGATELKSSTTITVPVTNPYSLWASTSTVTPHLYVSTAGKVGIGTAGPLSKFDVQDGSITVRGTSAGLVLENANRVISPETSAAVGAGVKISTNVYIVGFSSAAKYYGDGSGLTGLTGVADNLGNHTATANLNMSDRDIVGVSTITVSSITTTAAGVVFSTNVFVTRGNVGIGLSNPSAKLQVQNYQAGAYTMYISTDATPGQYSLAVSSTGATNIKRLIIENTTSDPPDSVSGQIWLRVD